MHASNIASSLTCSTHLFPVVKYVDRRLSIFMQFLLELDVINISGHRLGTAEVESALVSHESVAEAAVVGFPHDIKGEGIYVFVTLNPPKSLPKLHQQTRFSLGFDLRVVSLYHEDRLYYRCWRKYAVSSPPLLIEANTTELSTRL